ncbi:MAG: DUF3887 domain-containing protein [Elainella sp. Prado103]|nr:DUF3887 domain-containing protein [Elainella sp. Prado103]
MMGWNSLLRLPQHQQGRHGKMFIMMPIAFCIGLMTQPIGLAFAIPRTLTATPLDPISGAIGSRQTPIASNLTIAQADPSAELLVKVQRFFDLLFVQAGYSEASEMIAPVLQSEFSPRALERKRQEFEAGAGQFVKIVDEWAESDVVIVEAEFERRTVTFVVSFDANQQIAGVNPVLDFIGEPQP